MTIRPATADDVDQITQLFYDTITTVNAADYNADQIRAWRANYANKERWLNKISEQYFLVVHHDGHLAGFGSITPDNCLDYLFVHKDYLRKNIATQLLRALERVAEQRPGRDITADVSRTARPFFERHGFVVEREQTVQTNGVDLTNFRMVKLNPVQAV